MSWPLTLPVGHSGPGRAPVGDHLGQLGGVVAAQVGAGDAHAHPPVPARDVLDQ